LKAAGHKELLLARTGLGIDPLFPASKLAWLLDEVPGARVRAEAGELRAGTIDSWLIWNLTAGACHATDFGNASRTQLLDLHALRWDRELASLFGVPLTLLPEIRPSNGSFGVVAAPELATLSNTPIHAAMGDSHAALFGHRIIAPGAVKVTIGTGSSIMSLTNGPVRSANGLSTTIAWALGPEIYYAIEGNITVSGQAAAFATKLLGLASEEELSSLARTVEETAGVVFVPALAGLGAPHWRPEARGLMTGITHSTTSAHIARAAYEAIAMQIVDVCRAMEADIGAELPEISVDGGATRDDFLMQLLADLLDRPVRRESHAELGALGVARMAAESLGLVGVRVDLPTSTVFRPAMTAARRDQISRSWALAIRQTIRGE
jgi:glycerol kinase